MALVPPNGVFVPVPTFFKPKGDDFSIQADLDIDTQVKHSIFLAKNGVRGLVLLGSTGEAMHLTRQERVDLIKAVRKGLDGVGFPEYPIMAGTLVNGIEETFEWLCDSWEAGAQWGLVLAPGYFGAAASQDQVVEWYFAVAHRSPIPILIYNYPGVTNGLTLTPNTYSILSRHPNIVGCKMSHAIVSYHNQVSLDPAIDHTQFKVYSGLGQQLGPIVFFDAAGVVDGLAAIYPRTVCALMKLAEQRPITDENLRKIKDMQYVVSTAEDFIGKHGIIGIKEAIKRVTGFGTFEGGRLPIQGSIEDEEWQKWNKVWEMIGTLELSLEEKDFL